MVPGKRIELGRWGEEQAARFLTEHGLMILGRNIHTPYGEIDLLAKKEDVYIFVEVKTRSDFSFGYPEDSLTAKKKKHLVESALFILQKDGLDDAAWQVDVIAIRRNPGENAPEIIWYENAIS